MSINISFQTILQALSRRPQAVANVQGSHAYQDIDGSVYFYQLPEGVLVIVHIARLPRNTNGPFFGFHIHSGIQCSGTAEDPFANALTHYNPNQSNHPNHAGDLPPLLGNDGFSFQAFFTDRFTVREILHQTVIVHSRPDDFTSQPAGNAGAKIACGKISAIIR